MSGVDPAKQRDEAKAWLAKADEDLAAVRTCLDARPPVLGAAAYHCQQAAEKLIKGLLVLAAVPFRKTHDLDELSEAAAPVYPELDPLLAHVRVRTYRALRFAILCRPRAKGAKVPQQRKRSQKPCNGCRNCRCISQPPQHPARIWQAGEGDAKS